MNDIVKIKGKDIGGNTLQTVCARALHSLLESKQDFSTWIEGRIEEYGFIEGEDFTRFHKKMGANDATVIEYLLSLSMAKELSMLENNAKGKEARKYFIEFREQA